MFNWIVMMMMMMSKLWEAMMRRLRGGETKILQLKWRKLYEIVRSFSNQDLLFFLLFQLIISSRRLLQDSMIWTLRRVQFETDLLIPANVFPQILKEEQF